MQAPPLGLSSPTANGTTFLSIGADRFDPRVVRGDEAIAATFPSARTDFLSCEKLHGSSGGRDLTVDAYLEFRGGQDRDVKRLMYVAVRCGRLVPEILRGMTSTLAAGRIVLVFEFTRRWGEMAAEEATYETVELNTTTTAKWNGTVREIAPTSKGPKSNDGVAPGVLRSVVRELEAQKMFVLQMHRGGGGFRPLSHGYWRDEYERGILTKDSDVMPLVAISVGHDAAFSELVHDLSMGSATAKGAC